MILLIITLLIISQDGELTTSQGTLAQDALSKRAARGTSLTLRGVGKSKRRRGHPTLSNPMDWSLPGSSIHGTLQARVLEWGAIAFSEMLDTHALIGSQMGINYLPGFQKNNPFLFSFFTISCCLLSK